MARTVLIILSILFLTAFTSNQGTELLNYSSFKLTLVATGQEFEWEFENPDEFEYEVGNTVIKGEPAKTAVKKMFNDLQLKENPEAEEIKKILEKHGFHSIDRFVIRLKSFDDTLLTWSWVK